MERKQTANLEYHYSKNIIKFILFSYNSDNDDDGGPTLTDEDKPNGSFHFVGFCFWFVCGNHWTFGTHAAININRQLKETVLHIHMFQFFTIHCLLYFRNLNIIKIKSINQFLSIYFPYINWWVIYNCYRSFFIVVVLSLESFNFCLWNLSWNAISADLLLLFTT